MIEVNTIGSIEWLNAIDDAEQIRRRELLANDPKEDEDEDDWDDDEDDLDDNEDDLDDDDEDDFE